MEGSTSTYWGYTADDLAGVMAQVLYSVFECLFSLIPAPQSRLHASHSHLSKATKTCKCKLTNHWIVLWSTLTRVPTLAGYAVAM